MHSKRIIFSLIFLILSSITFFILNYEKENRIENYLERKTTSYLQNYNLLYSKYKKISQIIFQTNINKEKVKEIFKSRDRDKLYNYLKDDYAILKKHNIKQLHFHLPNNKSFLRFHRPNKYGDNLTNIRETVNYVNRFKKPIDGFEEGRIYNGYRFIYPLFYNNEYLGSVEVSFSTLTINKDFIKKYNVISNFLIYKNRVDKKVFDTEKSNYIKSQFKDFYIEKNNYIENKINISQEIKNKIIKDGLKKESFSIYNKNENIISTFIKIKHPLTKEVIALFYIESDAVLIVNKTRLSYILFFILFFILILLIYFILFFIYKELNYRDKIDLTNKKLSTILEEADSGIALMGLDGKFLKVNNAYLKLLGYTKDELLNLTCLDISTEETKKRAIDIIKEAKIKGKISKIRKKCIGKNGDIIVLELSLTLLPSKNAFISVINSLEDKLELEKLNKNLKVKIDDAIEESKLKNAILFQSSKMAAMGEMIDSIAHQWMQPIGVIGMKLQTLELDIELNKITEKRIKDVVETSEKQIQHLINTINEFRKFFRPNSRVERVSIKELIDSTILLMQDSLIKNNINIKLNGDIDILIDTNPSEFKHIFINLINNSQDAFNENKIDEHNRDIIFDIKKIDNKTSITILDNAGGIPKDIINNIFEPNFTTKTKGTGIGLYMTKQIINKNNSTINVKTIDNGTAFNILINS